jgi:hypothetical protein
VSSFVLANAGAGKTHLLVGRVIRLMLEGVEPERILCLTYTRALPRLKCPNACSRRWPDGWRWMARN